MIMDVVKLVVGFSFGGVMVYSNMDLTSRSFWSITLVGLILYVVGMIAGKEASEAAQ